MEGFALFDLLESLCSDAGILSGCVLSAEAVVDGRFSWSGDV